MTPRKLGSLAIGVISLAAASTVRVNGESSAQTGETQPWATELAPVSSFDKIADGRARSTLETPEPRDGVTIQRRPKTKKPSVMSALPYPEKSVIIGTFVPVR